MVLSVSTHAWALPFIPDRLKPFPDSIRPRVLWNRVYGFYHRGRHGWAEADTWSLDDHLSRVIQESVACLRAREFAYPTDLSPEEWFGILDKIVAGFAAADRLKEIAYLAEYAEEEQALRAVYREGFDLFRDRFDCLWD